MNPKPAKRRPRGPTKLPLPTLRRVMKASAQAGIAYRIEIDPGSGRIVMIPADQAPVLESNEWDRGLK